MKQSVQTGNSLPGYLSNSNKQEVKAFKIGGIIRDFGSGGRGVLIVIPEDKKFDKVEIQKPKMRMQGNVGDYFVRYSDGNIMFMGQEVFEKVFTPEY